jgi:hypothetical protein
VQNFVQMDEKARMVVPKLVCKVPDASGFGHRGEDRILREWS